MLAINIVEFIQIENALTVSFLKKKTDRYNFALIIESLVPSPFANRINYHL